MFIHVRFNRNYRAAGDIHKHTVEWPPSPYRFACAVVNAYYKSQRGTDNLDGRDAVEKFMALPLPSILTRKERRFYPHHSVFVPSNAPDQKNDGKDVRLYAQDCNKVLRHYPFVATDDIFYHWPGAEGVRFLLPYITHLGTASSLVVVDEELPNGEFFVWEPNEAGKHSLRCQRAGMLAELDLMYETGTKVYPTDASYACRLVQVTTATIPSKPIQNRHFEACYVLGVNAPFLNIFQVPRLAESLRNAIGKQANKMGLKTFEEEVFNHDPKTHLSYVPLPHVRGLMPSGDIKGIMVCLPRELVGFRDDLERCLFNLEKVPFYFGEHFIGDVALSQAKDLVTLRKEEWCRPSRRWTSATPLECFFAKGDPETQKRKMEDWCYRECSYYGLPTPISVEFSPIALWGHDARTFKNVRRESTNPKTKSFLSHLKLEFPIEVEGPVLLGRGRNFGTGLMYPR